MNDAVSNLSSKGKKLTENAARVDFEVFMEASQNLYSPDENPDGAFPLNVAENQLMASEIRNRLNAVLMQGNIPDWVLNYTHLLGNPEVRETIADFMETELCKCPISPESIGLSAGASAIIEVTAFVLTDPGDVVVIPAPSYPMYTNDLGLKTGAERFNLQTHHQLEEMPAQGPLTTALLDTVQRELTAKGKRFKMLLLTTPDNPTGIVYEAETLRDIARWCERHHVHMVVNEIYGLSKIDLEDEVLRADYPNSGASVSFAKIMREMDSAYLHMWYAFSKDFAMSGLRVGVVHSRNPGFMKAFENANVPHLVSNLTQWAIGELLKDVDFVKAYIPKNRKHLTKSYRLVVTHLRKNEIPYVPAKGSFFVWANFSKYLSARTDAGQEKLWLEIYRNTGVLLTPGEGFGHEKKGMFRIVFTAVPFSHLSVAMERLTNYLQARLENTTPQ